jgi:peptidylprolyl isomerase
MKLSYLLATGLIAVALAACNSQVNQETANPAAAPKAVAAVAQDAVPTEEAVAAVAQDSTSPGQPVAKTDQMAGKPEAKPLTLSEDIKKAFPADKMTTTNSGLQYLVEKEGEGKLPEAGNVVQVHYKGMLADGTVFDSSYERDEPMVFPLGKGAVIPGWEEAIELLPVGSKAKLVIPSELAYGEMGAGGVIPPNAKLYFEVELVDILPGSPESPEKVADADYHVTNSGLKYYDIAEGEGITPKKGQMVKVNYTGWLEDGTKFDSTLDWGQPQVFPVGEGLVIPGWDEGISTMKVGGKRQLVIPAELAFGKTGAGEVIPPDATLIFEVELVDVVS